MKAAKVSVLGVGFQGRSLVKVCGSWLYRV